MKGSGNPAPTVFLSFSGVRLMLAYSKEREIALQATIVASQFCEKVRRDQASQAFAKPDHSPVTIADYGAQALICQALKTQFPQDAVVGEEDPLVLSSPGSHAGKPVWMDVLRDSLGWFWDGICVGKFSFRPVPLYDC